MESRLWGEDRTRILDRAAGCIFRMRKRGRSTYSQCTGADRGMCAAYFETDRNYRGKSTDDVPWNDNEPAYQCKKIPSELWIMEICIHPGRAAGRICTERIKRGTAFWRDSCGYDSRCLKIFGRSSTGNLQGKRSGYLQLRRIWALHYGYWSNSDDLWSLCEKSRCGSESFDV